MNVPNLGRLVRKSLREAWPNEACNFTPWLARAENLSLLGEAIGRNLETHSEEHSVGPFRADILCRDIANDSWVLVENQLERTDHSHLGQLLTYAAGLDAVTIVWIAERFTDEHRAALDWLNEKTPDEIEFFGLEIEVWKIGDSALAPKFNVVCKPNEWTKHAVQSRSNPELNEWCWSYWSGVIEALKPSGIIPSDAQSSRRQNNRYPVGWKNFWLKSFFSRVDGTAGVWVACVGPRGMVNFETLQKAKDMIEASFGKSLWWAPKPEENRGTCGYVYSGIDPANRDDWPRQHRMLADGLTAIYRAVSPVVSQLDSIDEGASAE